MKAQTRKASWFVSGLLLFAAVSTGFGVVGAQPKGEASRPAFDTREATFELLGENKFVNINKIAYTSEENRFFDIYFTCSSSMGEDPLRLTDPKDIARAKSYFNDEKRCGRHFLRLNKYCISSRNIAYIESAGDSVIVRFNARISDSFVKVTLFGNEAETFMKKMRELD